jgi:hypothetical protein
VSHNDFKDITKKAALTDQLDQVYRNAIKNLEHMLSMITENGDTMNATKMKQAIIAVHVTYNRSRNKLR